MSNTILLVDHDDGLACHVADFLTQNGFNVLVETSGAQAVSKIQSEQPVLVILDVMLPGLDGLSVCRTVRPSYHGPIMMLTTLHGEVDEIAALETGADDYLVKPVRPRVLLARIRVLLRRSFPQPVFADTAASQREVSRSMQAAGQAASDTLDFDGLQINARSRTVSRDGCPITLTSAEFDLLWLLGNHAGRVLSRSIIQRDLRGLEYDGLDRSIDLRISRIRKKLRDDPREPAMIKSVRGVGYMLAC